MTSHAAVGVDDDLATREAGIAHRTTDHEPTGRVDEDVVVVVGKLFGNHRADHMLDQIGPDHRVAVDAVVVLRGDEHGLEPDGSVALVLEGDLGLGVGSQVRDGAGLADLGVLLGHAVRKVDRQRHEHVGLVAGVAEHHALVACALLVELVLLGLTRSDLF